MRTRTSPPRITLFLSILPACASAPYDGSNDSPLTVIGGTIGASSDPGDATSETGADPSGLDDTSSGSDGAADNTTTADPGTAGETGEDMSGEQQFLEICAPCHGMSGEGTELGYALQHPVRDYSTWVVRNGRPGDEFGEESMMDAFDPSMVSDATLEEIWDYLDAFPQPVTGESLYLDYCRNCHGVDAQGGVVGQDISGEDYESILETVREGENAGQFESRDAYMPAFDDTRLTDAELELIADYIDSL